MRLILFSFIMLICCLDGNGQNSADYGEMLKEADKILFSEPQESIKISEHVADKSEVGNHKIQAYLTISIAHYLKGDYDNSVKAVIEAKIHSETIKNVELQSKTGVYSVYLLYQLGLNVVAKEYLLTLHTLSEATNDKKNPWLKVGELLIAGFDNVEMSKIEKALEHFSKAESLVKQIHDETLLSLIQVSKYELELKQMQPTEALVYYDGLLKEDSSNTFHKLVLNTHLGNLNFLLKNYTQSINNYETALVTAKNFDNNYYQAAIFDALATNNLALDQKEEFQANKKSSTILASASEIDEDQAVNSIYNYINSNHTNRLNTVKKNNQTYLWILCGLIFMLAISYAALRWRYQSRAKQYGDFINFFEKRHAVTEEPKKEVARSSNIPKDTEYALLQQLKQFEKSKQFTKQDMSLAQLASSFDTNTRYLSEIINTQKDKNFNAYINELRINYIIDKLQRDRTYLQYKISYLAEESGFSSHSSFATVFKSVTGISPTVFIEILETQNKKSKTSKNVYEEVE